jgi:outer membrane protein with beta-barrel domain
MRMQTVRFSSALVFVAAVGGATPVAAQSFGGKGGYSGATVSFEEDRSGLVTSAQPSFVAGGWINFPLFGRFDIQVEGLYSKRVTKFEDVIKDSLEYFELPALLRYRLTQGPSWRFHVVGGAVYGRLLAASEEFSGMTEDIKVLIEPNDIALSIGADLEKGKWLFDFRYLYGLSEVYVNPASLFSARQKVIQVTAGYRIK